jgi:hypothetical protein
MGGKRAIAVMSTALAAVASAAHAATATVKRHGETVLVPPGVVTVKSVSYPDALKFRNATYSGTARIIGPGPHAHGKHPNLALVRILSKASSQGGSLFTVRIRNSNAAGTQTPRAVIAAITRDP